MLQRMLRIFLIKEKIHDSIRPLCSFLEAPFSGHRPEAPADARCQ